MKRFNFPGGEVHVQIEEGNWIQRFNLWSSDDIIAMLLATNASKIKHWGTYVAYIPYVPYARQDRPANPGEPNSIQVMAQLINSCEFQKVYIWDPHSDVAPALINKVEVWHQHEIIAASGMDMAQYDGIIAPDVGAAKKALKVAQLFDLPLYQAHKVRDTKTGAILNTIMIDQLPERGHYLVVDDICDGGRTFIELAERIACLARPLNKLDLYVTHGIFSKGINALFPYFNHVYCANSMKDWAFCQEPRFTQLFSKDYI